MFGDLGDAKGSRTWLSSTRQTNCYRGGWLAALRALVPTGLVSPWDMGLAWGFTCALRRADAMRDSMGKGPWVYEAGNPSVQWAQTF